MIIIVLFFFFCSIMFLLLYCFYSFISVVSICFICFWNGYWASSSVIEYDNMAVQNSVFFCFVELPKKNQNFELRHRYIFSAFIPFRLCRCRPSRIGPTNWPVGCLMWMQSSTLETLEVARCVGEGCWFLAAEGWKCGKSWYVGVTKVICVWCGRVFGFPTVQM